MCLILISSSFFFTHTRSYKAMLAAIQKAKHYVFIENQYFISATRAENPLPHNKIAYALLER